jgi:hypothetical protein
VRQRSFLAGWKQRVWKGHPGGGLDGLGKSPPSTIRLRRVSGSGSGTAESRATVYG